jgi:hypothetical protein
VTSEAVFAARMEAVDEALQGLEQDDAVVIHDESCTIDWTNECTCHSCDILYVQRDRWTN